MPTSPSEGSLQPCPKCAVLVDVHEQEPLSKIQCPVCGTTMRVSRQFNQFTIMETLGTGGMGAVYKALDRNLNRMVALKLLRRELSADEDYILKLEDEARITASINHPYVVKVFSFDHAAGQYYIAMELVDKGSLDDLMQLQNRVAELQVLQVGLQVASGLHAAHERGLIHRDVKPGNILFADAHTAKITDFGLALLAEHEAEARGEIWGTPYYIAPEKLNHEPEDFRSDIYSLGGTLFHAVAGRPPFEAESASMVALKHLKSRAVSLQAFAPDVSSETAYVINRMLNKDPADRYASYTELMEHLKYAADTLTANAGKPRAPKQRVVVEAESHRHLAGLLTLALLTVMIAGGILAFVFRERLFGEGARGAKPGVVKTGSLTSGDKGAAAINELYSDGRRQLASQQYAAAQESFSALASRNDLGQPLLNWVRLHQGLLLMLNHQMSNARDVFAAMQKAGPYSAKEADAKLAGFFTETGRYLADNQPIPATATKIWDKNTYENFSLLLFGLKDWELGSFESAAGFFREFLSGEPAGGAYQWIADYAPIARQCVHDYELYEPLAKKLQAKPTAPAERAALQAEFARARDQLQTSGKLAEAFSQAQAELRKKPGAAAPAPNKAGGSTAIAAAASPGAGSASAPPGEEAVRWQAAHDSYVQMVRLYRFDEAAAALQKTTVTDPDLQRAREAAQARARRLVAFKRTFIGDVKAFGGYTQPIVTRRNATFPRGLQGATAEVLMGATPYGAISVPWTDLAPKTLFVIANAFADATPDPKQAAERRWLAAVFAVENGLANEGRALATNVAKTSPEYNNELQQLLAAPAPTTPK